MTRSDTAGNMSRNLSQPPNAGFQWGNILRKVYRSANCHSRTAVLWPGAAPADGTVAGRDRLELPREQQLSVGKTRSGGKTWRFLSKRQFSCGATTHNFTGRCRMRLGTALAYGESAVTLVTMATGHTRFSASPRGPGGESRPPPRVRHEPLHETVLRSVRGYLRIFPVVARQPENNQQSV